MLTKIYYWFHRLISKPQERGEYSSGYWLDKVRKEILILCRGVQGRVLEIGCGEGLFLKQLAEENPGLEIWGIDNERARLSNLEKETQKKNIKNIRLRCEDATNLSFEDEYFERVVCINVFYNMESVEVVRKTLEQMKRVGKKSGRLLFDFRNSLNPFLVLKYRFAKYYDDTVRARNLPLKTYRLKEIKAILNDLSLKIVEKRFVGFPLGLFAPVVIIEAKKDVE